MSYTDVWFLTMWKSVFALAVTASVIWEASSTDAGCLLEDSSYYDSDSGSWEDDCYQCPKTNEVYDLCPVICPFRTCGIDDRLVDCSPSQPRPGDPKCPKPACRCKDQTFRDDKGNCVPWEKCPICTKPNEVYDPCDAPCPARRCDFNAAVVKCAAPPKIGDPLCLVGCRCEDGYLRDKNGVCIPAKQCPIICTKPNEVYDPCDAPCPARRCDFNAAVVKCASPPKIGDPLCLVGCRCEDGYLRDKNGVCIPAKQCPIICTKPNEVYDPCDAPCPARRCDFNAAVVRCAAPPKIGDPLCLVGCRCKDGYLRDKNGDCILAKQCPKCTKPNEVYDPCPDCSPQTCKTKDKRYCCPTIQANKTGPNCLPACRCKPGYFRNLIGECILASNCDKCPAEHEYFSCGSACDNVCATLSKQNKTNCPIKNIKCTEMCYCEDGYARATNNTCIPIEDCKAQCGRYERYVRCPLSLCIPQSCSQVGYPVACPIMGPNGQCPGNPGCICIDGYVRNNKGVCIPIKQCPRCAGDPNAVSGCGFRCGQHCSGKTAVPTPCPCNRNACECRSGYVYDDQALKCVRPCSCSKPCRVNEVYSPCGDYGCEKRNCTQIDQPDLCIDPIECKGGCVCAKNYLRSKNGICIPSNQCLTDKYCKKANEEYDPCPYQNCPARTCGIDDRLTLCPAVSAPKKCPTPICRCKSGYFRDDKGRCVLWENCPTCPTNEYYDPCPFDCPPRTCAALGRAYACPVPANRPCYPGCRCQSGFFRNNQSRCVTEEECSKNNTLPGTVTCSDDALGLLQRGMVVFNGLFLSEAYKSNPTKSLIASPSSVFVPLGMLGLYAEGETYSQIIKLLNLRSKDDIRCAFPAFVGQLRKENNITLNMAARIFSAEKYPLSETFVDDIQKVFDAGAENVNFTNPTAAANRINEWVSGETNDRIKDLATPDMFDENTRLVLANAIYFLGNWDKQFNPNDTKDRDFYVNNGTIKVPTMYQEGNFKYGEIPKLDCKVLEKIYLGGNFSFVVFLPNQVDGIAALVENLKDPDVLLNSYGATTNEKVQCYLPKIKTESEYDLIDILRKANISDLFNPDKSNLQGILKKYELLFVSTAKQKAFGQVDEVGTEAAAANIIVVGTTSAMYPPPKIYVFDANRPFVFYIFYEAKIPLFCGTVVNFS